MFEHSGREGHINILTRNCTETNLVVKFSLLVAIA